MVLWYSFTHLFIFQYKIMYQIYLFTTDNPCYINMQPGRNSADIKGRLTREQTDLKSM